MTMPQGFPPNQPHQPNPQTQQLPPQGFGPPPQGRGPQFGPPGPQGPQGPQGPRPQGSGPSPYGPSGPHGPQQFVPSNQQSKSSGVGGAIWLLGLVSVLAVALGLSIDEDGKNAWHTVHAWGGLALVGAVLTLAPVALANLSRQRAWQISACGAGALVLFWVLFTLPAAGSNTSLAITVGVACGVIATWIAPGRDLPGREAPGGDDRGHRW